MLHTLLQSARTTSAWRTGDGLVIKKPKGQRWDAHREVFLDRVAYGLYELNQGTYLAQPEVGLYRTCASKSEALAYLLTRPLEHAEFSLTPKGVSAALNYLHVTFSEPDPNALRQAVDAALTGSE